MPHFQEHPNWCDMNHAIERLDGFLDQLVKPDKTSEQGSTDDSTLLTREPFVITGQVNSQLSELIESDILNRLHKHPKSGAAVAMVADEDDRILESLREGILMLFPVEPNRGHDPSLSLSWVPALKRSIEESKLEGDLQRYLLIDQFHLILSASKKDRRVFGRLLRQLAALETVMVIVGVNESAKQETAELLEFAKAEEAEATTPMHEYARPEVELVKLKTLAHRRKKRAAAAGIALAGCITGAGLMSFFSDSWKSALGAAMASAPPQTLTVSPMNDALVVSVNPQGQIKAGDDFLLPSELSAQVETESVAGIGPDPEAVDALAVDELESTASRSDKLYFIAEAYCFGKGVETDLETGINYLNQAYNFGNEKAANLLGTCYSKGLGVEQNLTRAFELYEEAVNRGSIYAFGNIGVHYLRGWGCEANADKASAMFEQGALHGDPVAALYFAKCLEAGIGNKGKPDPEAARYWYMESAKKGNEGALLWCRENGVE